MIYITIHFDLTVLQEKLIGLTSFFDILTMSLKFFDNNSML